MHPFYPPRRIRHRAELLAQVGALYYLDRLTQADIATRLCLSRPKVSRLLCAARNSGIVRIVVKPPRGVLTTLETELEDRFGLCEARVVPLASGRSLEWAHWQLGVAAAADFARTLRSGHAVSLAGGRLIASMIDAVPALAVSDVRVIQGVGWDAASIGEPPLMDMVGELAHRIEATAVTLPAPRVVASEAVSLGLEADPHIGDALRALGSLDSLYVEVGSDLADAAARAPMLTGPPPVGHLALRHVDHRGRFLGRCADGHVLGITVEQMRHTARVVALAHGPATAHAIAAALRTGLVDTLITDELTAHAIAAVHLPQAEPVFSISASDTRLDR